MKKDSKEMTLEKLAQMVAQGFSHMEERMDAMATKEEMNEGFKKVDERFNEVDEKLQTIKSDILKQNDRFVIKDTFDAHVTRFTALEAKVKSKVK